MHFFKIIFDICLLRGRAQDLPASVQLVGFTAVASVVVKIVGASDHAVNLAELLFIVLQTALFGAVVWMLLRLRGVPARWVQVVTALYAVDVVLSLLFLPFQTMMVEMLTGMMEAIKKGTEFNPGVELYILFGFICWSLLIVTRVIREATDWLWPQAILAVFALLLVVQALGAVIAIQLGLVVLT